MFSKKHFIFGVLIGLILLFAYFVTLPDGKLHIVFCDVGQGDAAYIRTPNNQDLLIDGGPNDKVLECLGRHMAFYDRTIDLVMLSHPQKDHLQGLIPVLERYTVNNFVIGNVGNQTEGYQKLQLLLQKKNIPIRNLYMGDVFSMGEVKFKVLWPDREWVLGKIQQCSNDPMLQCDYRAIQRISSGSGPAVLGMTTSEDLNSFSYYLHLQYKEFDALFTGDGDSKIQPEILKSAILPDVEVLKFPHHGSKYGILAEFLDKIKPEEAVISVGKNSYGHPTKEAIELLSNKAIKIKRTDLDGDVEVVTDGKVFNNR